MTGEGKGYSGPGEEHLEKLTQFVADHGHDLRVLEHALDETAAEVWDPHADVVGISLGEVIEADGGSPVDSGTVSWWEMNCGRVLGIYDGRLIEYEPSTLAPLGLVVGADELAGRRVLVVGSGLEAACRR